VTLSFQIDAPETVWCDDVMLIDNTQWLQIDNASWSLSRRGYSFVLDSPGKFNIRLATAENSASGWSLEEINSVRARFNSNGPEKSLTIYPDGRSYWDGKFRPLSASTKAEALWQQDQDSPAEIQVSEPMGRVNRTTAGDANNDGYNESRGTYTVVASGSRIDLTIVPHSAPILQPVFEITGLPDGKPLVTLEGQLIEKAFRLPDGTWLIQIPAKIERSTSVNIRVQ
jgi:hypothetical protein